MTEKGFGAQRCPRCGARVDARRSPALAICLTCGSPLGGQGRPSAAPPASSSALPIAIVVGALGLVAMLGVFAVLLRSRAGAANARGTSVVESQDDDVTAAARTTAAPSAVPSASAPRAPAPLTDQERDELAGSYTCSLDDTPPFHCRIANLVLEKLDGSQRFKGPVTKLDGGNFSFSGTFFCPFGACTHPVAATFARQGPGRYVGKFGPNSVPGGGPGNERIVLTKVR